MTIYKIGNVDQSEMHPDGNIVWSFPEAYDKAQDGDVLEVLENVTVDLKSYQTKYPHDYYGSTDCSGIFGVFKDLVIKGNANSKIVGYFYAKKNSIIFNNVILDPAEYTNIFEESKCSFNNVTFLKTLHKKDETTNSGNVLLDGSLLLENSKAKIFDCKFNEDLSLGTTHGLSIKGGIADIADTNFYTRVFVYNNADVNFFRCRQYFFGEQYYDFVGQESKIYLENCGLSIPDNIAQGSFDNMFLIDCQFKIKKSVIAGSMQIR